MLRYRRSRLTSAACVCLYEADVPQISANCGHGIIGLPVSNPSYILDPPDTNLPHLFNSACRNLSSNHCYES
jgi:hypothetical protein